MRSSEILASSASADLLSRISSLKVDVNFLMEQLSEGEYLSVDTFANNWVHLIRMYAGIQEHMKDPKLMDILVHTDLLLAADLMAVGRIIEVLNNFLRCAVKQSK
ncbi:hypothetical protein ERHA54_50150 (plasmid) [Erwinia rhapontici]|nr:hypothetical protein ERHA54_50150 [Erwinia rhapontici]